MGREHPFHRRRAQHLVKSPTSRVGQFVLDDIRSEKRRGSGRDHGHVKGGRSLGELEGNRTILAYLEECSVPLGGVGTLDSDGFDPGEAAYAHASLETNRPDGDGVVAMSSVDADHLCRVAG